MSIKVTPEDLAREIRNVMWDYLGDDETFLADLRNRAETNPNIDHAHDFCDANEALFEACEALNIDLMDALRREGEDADADATMALVNAAHDLVIKQGYAPRLIDSLHYQTLFCRALALSPEDTPESEWGELEEEQFDLYATLWLLDLAAHEMRHGSRTIGMALIQRAQTATTDDLLAELHS